MHEAGAGQIERFAGNNNDNSNLGAGAEIPPPRSYHLPVTDEAPRPALRGVQETAGTSILSVGTAAQIRGQRNRFIAELNALIDEDTAAWQENRRIVRQMLAEEISKAERPRGM